MSSYYNRIIGTLSPSEIARSEDIHLIQSSIQNAFQEVITDLFGTGCILGDEEEDLKLIPTPYVIDQSNTNYDEEKPWISFTDIYLRQQINIDKSEIQAIRVTVQNNTNLMPTIFAEIRDKDFNLVKETNIKMPAQTEDEGEEIDFIFNLQHLPLDTYYFVIRPIDINTADLTANGDETQYDTITEESFQIKYDKNGNYDNGLYASYNGVDYLEARLLESELKSVTSDGFIETEDENFDLCFEHIFSSGNTYVINNIAPCIVLGEKIYPIDTHVSIDGPSINGNRIDLISLNTDGQLNVTKGVPFIGTATEENYPISNTDFKLAYITTFYGTDAEWYCNTCGTKNNSNITTCKNCGTTISASVVNVKPPLIEQNDDNGITRRRDILERLRRLEKKMNYQTEYNSPSRIKYNCTIPPVIDVKEYPEGAYGVKTIVNEKGENIVTADTTTNTKSYTWSISDAVYEYSTGVSLPVTVKAKDLYVQKDKPDKKTFNKAKHCFHVKVRDESDKPPIIDIKLNFTIKNKKTKKVVKKVSYKVNSDGDIYIDPWKLGLKEDIKYEITTSYSTKNMTNIIRLYSKKGKYSPQSQTMKIGILDGSLKENLINVDKNTFTGDDSFAKTNVEVNTDTGEVFLEKRNTKEQSASTYPVKNDVTQFKHSYVTYKINPNKESLQSEYPMYVFTLDRDCYVEDILFYISSTKNLKYMRALLFQNNRITNYNTSRKNYRKYLRKEDAEDTAFPNKRLSDQIQVQDGKNFKYTMKINKTLEKGTYNLLFYGILKNKKQDGYIKIKEFHTPKATQYGCMTKVKGTSSPNQVFIGGENLVNRTMHILVHKIDHVHNTDGTLISKTINTGDNIISCDIEHYYDIPNGCYIHTYVSNNGGKTWVEQANNNGKVSFNGSGHELKWRLVFVGNEKTSPKLKFNKNKKYAFKVTVTTGFKPVAYEDYDRCFATPLLNANAITRQAVVDSYVERPMSEWEYARLWMNDNDLNVSDIDICFSYGYNDYATNTTTPIDDWSDQIFFSQIFASLQPDDFTRTSVDYDNYNAAVESDEMNFRFKLQTEYMYNDTIGKIIASPVQGYADIDGYSYGDISSEDQHMDMFQYGLMQMSTQNGDQSYFQAMYQPTTQIEGSDVIAWAKDSDPTYTKDCIIGVKFANGVTIEKNHTNLKIGIFPNLRDCAEKDISTGELQLEDGQIQRTTIHTTKYYHDNVAYIPANTLELVLAFNPYGLVEDNNKTYGEVIPIKEDLNSCEYKELNIDISELYGTTIYSIGIRVSENATYEKIYGNTDDPTTVTRVKHPSLQAGDIIGLGSISFRDINILTYAPYQSQARKQWIPFQTNENVSVAPNPSNVNDMVFNLDDRNSTTTTDFRIKTNINLVPYNYINVKYFLAPTNGHPSDDKENITGELHKGDITLELYDTDENITYVEPVERLELPAWGAIQRKAKLTYKTVNAWFKIRSDAKSVKCIRLTRHNPTNKGITHIKLHIQDIAFYTALQMPALGPQMQMRIYPKSMNGVYSTQIRKFGGIFRLR